MASLSDILTTAQQGVVAVNALNQQMAVAAAAWTSYTLTVTPQTGSLTSYTVNYARYKRIGKTVFINVSISITNAGTASGALFGNLPLTPAFPAILVGREDALTGKMVQARVSSIGIVAIFYDNTSVFATGNLIVLSGTYESQ